MCFLPTVGPAVSLGHSAEYVLEKCGNCPNPVQWGETTTGGPGDPCQDLLGDTSSRALLWASVFSLVHWEGSMIHGSKLLTFWTLVRRFRLENMGAGPYTSPSGGSSWQCSPSVRLLFRGGWELE